MSHRAIERTEGARFAVEAFLPSIRALTDLAWLEARQQFSIVQKAPEEAAANERECICLSNAARSRLASRAVEQLGEVSAPRNIILAGADIVQELR